MYSGTTLTKLSGRFVGAHQKFDSVSRRHLNKIIDNKTAFPKIRRILSFEGKNGPDGIKRKSPAKDEPWHYFNPFDDKDSELITQIEHHFKELVHHLQQDSVEKSSFEAAWLAHAIVDGLTPAHHYPYEEKLSELRGGAPNDTRTTVKDKIIIPGDTKRDMMKKNWKMWGPKGLITTHGFFEFGVAAIIKPLTFNEAVPTKSQIKQAQNIGIGELFRRSAREIAVLNMYEAYYKKGWTPKLAWQVRHKLGPIIVQTVTLSWYLALVEAGLQPKL
ncbi:hypothetical protein KDA00_01290 [Candidatus Saccharibacteria bacterium]|nr:hypothetical protein [Candidatus Saccharibacteria bacterium]